MLGNACNYQSIGFYWGYLYHIAIAMVCCSCVLFTLPIRPLHAQCIGNVNFELEASNHESFTTHSPFALSRPSNATARYNTIKGQDIIINATAEFTVI